MYRISYRISAFRAALVMRRLPTHIEAKHPIMDFTQTVYGKLSYRLTPKHDEIIKTFAHPIHEPHVETKVAYRGRLVYSLIPQCTITIQFESKKQYLLFKIKNPTCLDTLFENFATIDYNTYEENFGDVFPPH